MPSAKKAAAKAAKAKKAAAKQAVIDAQAERVKKAIEKVNGSAEVDEALERAGLPSRAPVAPELNLLAEMQLRQVGHTSETAKRVVKKHAEGRLAEIKAEQMPAADEPYIVPQDLSQGGRELGLLPGMEKPDIIALASSLGRFVSETRELQKETPSFKRLVNDIYEDNKHLPTTPGNTFSREQARWVGITSTLLTCPPEVRAVLPPGYQVAATNAPNFDGGLTMACPSEAAPGSLMRLQDEHGKEMPVVIPKNVKVRI